MTKEQLILSFSRAFMDYIIILNPSKIAAYNLLQRYPTLFTRMKTKPKKSQNLSFVGCSVGEIIVILKMWIIELITRIVTYKDELQIYISI